MLTPSFASFVEAPKCGVKIISGADNNGLLLSSGSDSKTSKAAPDILFSFRTFDRSFSLIIPPLATFTILASFSSLLDYHNQKIFGVIC